MGFSWVLVLFMCGLLLIVCLLVVSIVVYCVRVGFRLGFVVLVVLF